MKAIAKMRPAADSQLRRLKDLPAADRAEIWGWRKEFPLQTNAQIRERIRKRFGIELRRDGQLSEFWRWQFGQAALDALADATSSTEESLRDKFPGLSRDKIRDLAIKQSYAVAALLREENPGFTLKVVEVDRKDRAQGLDQKRFQRETCELFLKWQADEQARAIAAGAESNTSKIERLGKLMFQNDW